MKKLAIVVLCTVLSTSCIPIMFVSPNGPPPIAMIQQRDLWDCGIATMAMMARKSYNEVEAAVLKMKMDPTAVGGIYEKDAIKVLKSFGVSVQSQSEVNMADDEGLMHVRWNDSSVHHYIFISHGWIYDPLTKYPVPVDVSPQNWEFVLFLKKL